MWPTGPIAAEEIFGGTSEKLAGIINLTTAEFAALETAVIANFRRLVWRDPSMPPRDFDQEVNGTSRQTLARGTNALAVSLLPALTDVTVYLRQTALPAFKEFKNDILEPIIGVLKDVGRSLLGLRHRASSPDMDAEVANRVLPVLQRNVRVRSLTIFGHCFETLSFPIWCQPSRKEADPNSLPRSMTTWCSLPSKVFIKIFIRELVVPASSRTLLPTAIRGSCCEILQVAILKAVEYVTGVFEDLKALLFEALSRQDLKRRTRKTSATA